MVVDAHHLDHDGDGLDAAPPTTTSVVFDNVYGLKSGVEILYEGYPGGTDHERSSRSTEERQADVSRIDVNGAQGLADSRGQPGDDHQRALLGTGGRHPGEVTLPRTLIPPGSEIPSLAKPRT